MASDLRYFYLPAMPPGITTKEATNMRTIRLRASPSPFIVRAIFPPDPELISLIKAVPGRKWNPAMRVWDIPSTPETLEALRASLPDDVTLHADETVREAHARQLAALVHANSARERGDSDIAFNYVTQPYGHQRAGLEFLAHLGGGGLLFEMGTGKTKVAIDFCEWLEDQEDAKRRVLSTTSERQIEGRADALESSPSRTDRGGAEDVRGRPSGDYPREGSGPGGPSKQEHVEPASPLRRDQGSLRRDVDGTGGAVRPVPVANGPGRGQGGAASGPRSRNQAAAWTPVWEMQSGVGIAQRRHRHADTGHRLRVLVVCPNSVKRMWGDEIEKHAGHNDYAIDSPVGERMFTIVNCEKLSIKSTLTPLAEREWDVVIADESTRFKNPTAARTKALHKLKTRHRLILTGTPITGKPEDAWAQFQFVAPGLLGSWWSFRDRYLALDYFKRPIGIKPGMTGELKSLIAGRSYRVLKQDVLDLPPKVYADRIVEMTGVQKTAYHQMKEDLRVQIEGMEGASAFNILTVLLRLTQITAGLVGAGDRYTWLDKDNAKLDELDNLLLDELAGEQVVIFGQYQRELEQLAKRYCRSEFDTGFAPIIYGPTPERDRHLIIEQFQSGSRRLLFAQQRTGGIGITLTAAKTCVYYTRSWSLEEYLQSQDRLHRIGQTGTVSVLHLIAKGTIDEEIAKALRGKQHLADQLTGDDARRIARDLLR